MEKYKITKVSSTNLKKDGTAIINKFGKPSWRVGIKTVQHGEKWVNGFLPFEPNKWEGTEQELEIYEEEYNGEKRLAFRLPKKDAAQNENILKVLQNTEKILTQIMALKNAILILEERIDGKHKKIDYPPSTGPTAFDEGEVASEDLPDFLQD